MKTEATDIIKDNLSASTECWERKGDAIVDECNGRTASDFINALKDQSVDAWLTVKKIVVNPVLHEKKIMTLIVEKKMEADEIFGIFIERMISKGGLKRLKDPDKVVPFMQQCVRGQIKRCTTKKEKKRVEREVLIDDYFQSQSDIDIKDGTNPINSIPESEALVADRDSRLMEDEKAIVRKCFKEFWKKHPKYAYVIALRNSGLDNHEINQIIAVGTDNYVSNLVKRGRKDLAKRIIARNVALPGVPQGKKGNSYV